MKKRAAFATCLITLLFTTGSYAAICSGRSVVTQGCSYYNNTSHDACTDRYAWYDGYSYKCKYTDDDNCNKGDKCS